ncbi:MAG TPA: metallopeptidase TldD-related protein [Candidatus Dormibacteraeota bacterium]|nr:metallopeptidase TldD-related protein [Candidatus Dormibacteraeota bacterium]
MALRDRDACLSLADAVLSRIPDGSEGEVIVEEVDSALTRYALNAIHQNVAESGLRVRLRLLRDGRTGVADVRGAGEPGIERLVRDAEEARRLARARDDQPPLPDLAWAGLDGAGDGDGRAAWSDSTAQCTPEQRADAVAVVAAAAAARRLEAFGAMETTARQLAISNTRGVRRHARTSIARLTAVVRGADGAGYADRCASAVDSLDPAALAAEVVETASRNQRATAVDHGTYEVILSPYAVAEMLDYLAYMSFSALARQEGRSFVRPGEKMMSDSVTLRDDARDPLVLPFPFDWEGVTTRPVTFVDGGVCRDLVYDTPTALVDGVRSTGHALPMPNTHGPVATHLVMDPGESSRDAMIGDVQRGLYVTRFWYVREVHPLRTVITGMTREGTFLIEDGHIGRPVRDLRFTQSIVDALADVRAISRERSLEVPGEGSATLAPWLHLGHFHFSS